VRAPPRRLAIVAAVAALGVLAWQSQLVRVDLEAAPRPLVLLPESARTACSCDVVLPVVPVGMTRVSSGGSPLLIHYWAPWERNGREQAAALDSLVRTLGATDLRVMLVTSDPFPSVARFVLRHRLKLPVLLDGPGHLRARIPRPRLPHTVAIDRAGREAVVQSGQVDWLAPETRQVLEALIGDPSRDPRRAVPPPGSPGGPTAI